MHKENFEITLDTISKIEGHAGMDIEVRNGEVQQVRLRVAENMRFFREAVRGKRFNSAHQLVSRICGTCSAAHLMGSIECIEKIFGIHPAEQVMALKHLTMNAMQIRDHAMHLFFFCLPDVFGKDSVLDFKSDNEKDILHKALHIKEAGNMMGNIIGGRSVHPTLPTIGGFMKIPKKEDLNAIAKTLRAERESMLELAGIFQEWDKELMHETNYVATEHNLYNFLEGALTDSRGFCIPDFAFTSHLNRVVKPYSQATGFLYKGDTYMVGALARMNIGKNSLHRDTKRDLAGAISKFPSKNVYHNNLAQAIEIVHAIDHSLDLLEGLEPKEERPPQFSPTIAGGTGIVEAPRGTLYYYFEFDDKGAVAEADLVIPTAQNHIIIEKDCGQLVQQCIGSGMGKKDIERELEILIRAYDPCMSCASNFLKVNWK